LRLGLGLRGWAFALALGTLLASLAWLLLLLCLWLRLLCWRCDRRLSFGWLTGRYDSSWCLCLLSRGLGRSLRLRTVVERDCL
jgi:hypothetical protein